MNATPNEVQLILDAIRDGRGDTDTLREELRNESGSLRQMIREVKDEIGEVKADVGRIEQFRWQIIGGAAALSMAAGIAFQAVNL